MKQFPFLVCLAFLTLLVQAGTVSAASPTTTTTTSTLTAETTITPDRTGGSIYFETEPSGAKIWLNTIEIGISPFTYYSEKTGTMEVRAWRKGYENYTGTVTVSDGKRVVFSALLKEVSRGTIADPTLTVQVTTATTIRKSTMNIPTTWPTTSEKSPVDAAVVIGASALGICFFVIRRR